MTLDDDKGNKLVIESNSGAITITSTASLKLKSQTHIDRGGRLDGDQGVRNADDQGRNGPDQLGMDEWEYLPQEWAI